MLDEQHDLIEPMVQKVRTGEISKAEFDANSWAML
jgi:hypothetical protein